MNRDSEGRATVRAVRASSPIRLDGRLDEPDYATVMPMGDFIQTEPKAGEPASERTEAWVLFDDKAIYVSFRCWERQVGYRVANEMRRDNATIIDNDHVAFILDTYHDFTSALYFAVNAVGGRMDGQFTGFQYNGDWNPVWDSEVGRFDGGWTAEIAIPFSSVRYAPGRDQTWDINLQRTARLRNEYSFLTRLGNARGSSAINQMNQEATLVGLQAPPQSRNVDVKPYVVSSLTTDQLSRPVVSNDLKGAVGVDLKYGITQNLTADLTVNTDFAQVEADQQQVNLTRFSLFFPEKRDFFLENQGTFLFGIGGASTGVGISPTGDVPVLFYSRRVGLDAGRQIPIRAGGRVTGRIGKFTLGAINIQTGTDASLNRPGTNFSVVRAKRDVLRRSTIGAIYTDRSTRELGQGRSRAYGADGSFNFFTLVAINTYWARSEADSGHTADTSYRAQLDYPGDRYTVQLEHLKIGPRFNPELGFLRRSDIRKSVGSFRFSPRPKRMSRVRKYYVLGTGNYLESTAGRVEWREFIGESGIEFQNGDKLSMNGNHTYEYIPRPFTISPGVMVATGGYDYANARLGYTLARQHRVAGTLSVERGTLYGGSKTGVGYSGGRITLTSRFSAEPSVNLNRVSLPQGAFTNTLIGGRLTYTVTPRLFVSGLIQYNSGLGTFSSNVRLRWEYEPGSEFFVVYNDQRDTRGSGFPELQNRAVIVKLNKLLRF